MSREGRLTDTMKANPGHAALKLVAIVVGSELVIMVMLHEPHIRTWLSPDLRDVLGALLMGIITGVLAYFWIVIPQLCVLEKLEQANQEKVKLSRMINMTPDFVSIMDVSGRLLFLNHGGRQMIGLNNDADITSLHIADLHPAKESGMILGEGLSAALRDGAWSHETVLLTRDGRNIPVSNVLLAHRAGDGSVECISTFMHDMSEIQQIRQHVAQNERLSAMGMVQISQRGHLKLDIELPENMPKLACTPDSLEQILVNLLFNALDAADGHKDGKITISATLVADMAAIIVVDNGPGIGEEIRDKIFDPFFTTKEIGKGTGMGLPVSRELAETAGGELSLAAGKSGTAFLLKLPLLPDTGEMYRG